jgi:hypothetical protein
MAVIEEIPVLSKLLQSKQTNLTLSAAWDRLDLILVFTCLTL